MRAAYRARYNTEPPLDVWSLHTYNLNWSRLPMLDPTDDQAQITTMRAGLDAAPALRGKPVWLTEFGVIWAYEGMQWQTVGGAYRAVPTGAYRSDLLRDYFNTTLDWLDANSTRLNVQRWFVYTSYGTPEPFTNTFTGLSLFAAPPQPGVKLIRVRRALRRTHPPCGCHTIEIGVLPCLKRTIRPKSVRFGTHT